MVQNNTLTASYSEQFTIKHNNNILMCSQLKLVRTKTNVTMMKYQPALAGRLSHMFCLVDLVFFYCGMYVALQIK